MQSRITGTMFTLPKNMLKKKRILESGKSRYVRLLVIIIHRRGKKDPKGAKNHTKAMRVLGLGQNKMHQTKEIKVVNVKKFKEEEVIEAFQKKCIDLGKR